MTSWTDLPTHTAWLARHGESLLTFARRAGLPDGGGAWLTDDGRPWPERGVHTWITSRTVHVFSIGHLLGVPGSRLVARDALAGLTGRLRDAERGGWFASVGPDGVDGTKAGYAHAFVLLAASSATVAGLPGASDLLDEAGRVFVERFWDDDAGLAVDTWDEGFTTLDPYRGINANMHAVEAMLAAADVTGDRAWLDRAERVGRFVVAQASAHDWRVPEHFGPDWVPDLDLNRDRPDDPFKPFGATVGHGLEWARLLLHLEAALAAAEARPAGSAGPVGGPGEAGPASPADDRATGRTPTDWLAASRGLFDRAVADGWHADGEPGFVYTTDWEGRPVVRDRMHWVVAEALGAAAALFARTREPAYADRYATWWDYADRFVVDHEHGSWHHQLDAANRPVGTVWPGKADVYHAFQATLVPRLPLAPSFASAVGAGLLA